MQYLETRGITDKGVYSAHRIGFANGTLLNVLPHDGDISGQLKGMGVLTDKGHEHFYGHVTFPLYDANGNPCGIYGRRLDGMVTGNVPDHLYLPGQRRGLFNRQAAKAHKEIILTVSVIDAVTLIDAGIKNAIPCYGINGLTDDHLQWLTACGVDTVHVCFDADASGQAAAEKTAEKLAAEGFTTRRIDLPEGKDINDFFLLTADPATAFKTLIGAADPEAEHAVKEKETRYTATDFGFVATIDSRSYEVRGIARRENKLKATVKGIAQDNGKKRFHVDTVDFYSARSRGFLFKGLADLFGIDEKAVADDLQRLMQHAESYQPPQETKSGQTQMTADDKQKALALLKNPAMFDEILDGF